VSEGEGASGRLRATVQRRPQAAGGGTWVLQACGLSTYHVPDRSPASWVLCKIGGEQRTARPGPCSHGHLLEDSGTSGEIRSLSPR
jgi:hypothetical protein